MKELLDLKKIKLDKIILKKIENELQEIEDIDLKRFKNLSELKFWDGAKRICEQFGDDILEPFSMDNNKIIKLTKKEINSFKRYVELNLLNQQYYHACWVIGEKYVEDLKFNTMMIGASLITIGKYGQFNTILTEKGKYIHSSQFYRNS